MTNAQAFHILNHGRWRDYLDTNHIPENIAQELKGAIDVALEALALRATAEKIIRQEYAAQVCIDG